MKERTENCSPTAILISLMTLYLLVFSEALEDTSLSYFLVISQIYINFFGPDKNACDTKFNLVLHKIS